MKTYLIRLLISVIGILSAIAGINIFINPYGYFDVPRIAGVNKLTLGFNHHLPLAKALAISHIRPATVIVGNSRAEAGYDPDHSSFNERPAYNLALGGAGIGQMRRYLLEAIAIGKPRHVLLTLDYTMFDASVLKPVKQEDIALLTDESGKISDASRKWRRLAIILFSGTTLADSWWSLTHQKKPVAIYLPSGLRDEASDMDQVMREGGHRSASLRVEATFLAATLRNVASPEYRRSYEEALAQLRALAALMAEQDIKLTLVINPIHARHNYLYDAAGLWPAYEAWKRDLMTIAAASPRPDRAALWDFSGVSACTAEPMPANGDTTARMRWYRETSHFRVALGNEVLDRISGSREGRNCAGFGMRLESATLTADLARQRKALDRWIGENPEYVAEIDAMARTYGRR